MQQTIKLIVQLCFFRGTPADLPYSRLGLLLLTFMYFGIRWMVLNALPGAEESYMFGVAALWTVSSLAAVYLLLRIRGLSQRWLKVMTALLATEICFLVLFRVLSALMLSLGALNSVFINFALVWMFLIRAYIFRVSIETNWIFASLMVLLVEIGASLPVSYLLIDVLENLKLY